MKIRLALTLDVRREPRVNSEPEREVQLDSYVESAGPQPIGFYAHPGRDTNAG